MLLLRASALRRQTALPRCPAAAAAHHRRSYFSAPVPTLSLEQIVRRSYARGVRARRAIAPTGMPLNEHERIAAGAARRSGVLQLRPHCGQSLVNLHYAFCVNDRRPFLAIDRTGRELRVDVRPVVGTSKVRVEESADRVQAAFADILTKLQGSSYASSLQIVNASTLEAQLRSASVPSALEGSNAGRKKDAAVEHPVFSVLTSGHDQAAEIGGLLADAFATTTGRPTRADAAVLATQRSEERGRAWRTRMVRHLTRLVNDTAAVRQLRVKAGAVDGFVSVMKAGQHYVAIEAMAERAQGLSRGIRGGRRAVAREGGLIAGAGGEAQQQQTPPSGAALR